MTMPQYDRLGVTTTVLAVLQQIVDLARQGGELAANVEDEAEHPRIRSDVAAY